MTFDYILPKARFASGIYGRASPVVKALQRKDLTSMVTVEKKAAISALAADA